MFAMYANGWSSALENPVSERERINRLVLAEARATDWPASNGGVHEADGLLDRVRRAMGIAPAQAQPRCVACAT